MGASTAIRVCTCARRRILYTEARCRTCRSLRQHCSAIKPPPRQPSSVSWVDSTLSTHETRKENAYPLGVYLECCSGASFEKRARALASAGAQTPENMLHHKLPAEPNSSHSTRQSIHSRQLKSNFHSSYGSRRIVSSASEVGERPSVGPSRTPLRQSGRARTTPYAHGRSAPTAALRCDRNGSAQPGLARPSSEPPAVAWQQQRFDGSLGAGGHCSRGAEAVRRVRDGLQLHWQLPERVRSAAVV